MRLCFDQVLQEGQEGNDVNLSYGYHRMGFLYPPQQFDLIISQNCSLRHFQFPDGNIIVELMIVLPKCSLKLRQFKTMVFFRVKFHMLKAQ